MRTKDRPHFLERALTSVLGQTHRDFELVLVNDGGAREPIEEIVGHAADPRVHVLHNPDSAGMVAATNRALAESESTYVAVHDDDDTWAPTFLERTTARLATTAAMGLVTTTDRINE